MAITILSVVHAEPAVQLHTGLVGWDLKMSTGSLWLTSQHCAETPQPGEQVAIESERDLAFGQRITAIVIGGRRYR
jgi:hypothetical protein